MTGPDRSHFDLYFDDCFRGVARGERQPRGSGRHKGPEGDGEQGGRGGFPEGGRHNEHLQALEYPVSAGGGP